MKASIRAGAVIFPLVLGACSSGGGGGGSPATTIATPAPTPTPTPTQIPAPTPTPTPTPVATNTSLTNLQYSQSFSTVGASASATINPPVSAGPASVVAAAVDSAAISYNANTQGYTLVSGGENVTFLPSDKDAASSTSTVTTYSKTSGSTQDILAMSVPGASGLSYSSLGDWLHISNTNGSGLDSLGVFVFGIPTAATDLPKTGTATYQTGIGGFWEVANDLRTLSGSSTLTANFAAGTTQLSMSLSGTSQFNQATSTLGSFSGSGSINSAAATFTGNLASTSSGSAGYSGVYAGRFYGPAAIEAGATFSLTNGSGAGVVGVLAGHK